LILNFKDQQECMLGNKYGMNDSQFVGNQIKINLLHFAMKNRQSYSFYLMLIANF
jgi:hypothetical protein